jgi:hypothetical protein
MTMPHGPANFNTARALRNRRCGLVHPRVVSATLRDAFEKRQHRQKPKAKVGEKAAARKGWRQMQQVGPAGR